jgi:hypothetical protein
MLFYLCLGSKSARESIHTPLLASRKEGWAELPPNFVQTPKIPLTSSFQKIATRFIWNPVCLSAITCLNNLEKKKAHQNTSPSPRV